MVIRAKAGIHKPKMFVTAIDDDNLKLFEPTTFKQAVQHDHWQQAMTTEFLALRRNNTQVLVAPPSNHKIIGYKWVYKVKLRPNGTIERCKARLVAKGYHQTLGFNYFETFSPVVKPTTIRVVLSLALSFHSTIKPLDMHNAFLNRDLLEDVFMSQPPGFINSNFPHHVCKLNKALYGLKQSRRAWYTKLSHCLTS